MLAAIHPDGSALLIVVDVLPDRDQFLRNRIAFFPNPEVVRTTIDIAQDMRFTLMLGNSEARRIPGERVHTRAIRDRKAEIVRELGARASFVLIFVHHGSPV